MIKQALKSLNPPEKISVSQWADKYRKLSPEASSEAGQWLTSRAPYQKEIMDAAIDPDIETIVIMSSAQIGKTEIINNIIAYHIASDPAPILVVHPTEQMALSWSLDRLAPMIRDSSVLERLVKEPRAKESNNRQLYKKFPAGHISIVGSNAPASLASRPIRILLCDEVDRYPPSSGAEGDPVNLAKKRTTTFANKKIILTSTPTIAGVSRIEAAYKQSDRRSYHVACPFCSEFQELIWSRLRWDENLPETARYACCACDKLIDEKYKYQMLQGGKWVKSTKEKNNIAGFYINELYSPWSRWSDMATEFLRAKKMPETLKTFINTSLGQVWQEDAELANPDNLVARKENWGNKISDEILIITAGIDVQKDRLEIEIVGWGLDGQSWSLDWRSIRGDPSGIEVWKDLDVLLNKDRYNESGVKMRINAASIDSGGHHTASVYSYCSTRYLRRIFAIKGSSAAGKPIASKPTRNNKAGIRLFMIGTDSAKEIIYSRLKINKPGPGYCHFPASRDDEYFKQLTSERAVTRYKKGFAIRVWEKNPGQRNDALDARVYAFAALEILNPDFEAIAQKMNMVQKEKNIKRKKYEHRKNFVFDW